MFKTRTTYRIHTTESHVRIGVWVSGALAGEMTFRSDEAEVANAIIDTLARNGATNSRQQREARLA
jgi:hypothetical protein